MLLSLEFVWGFLLFGWVCFVLVVFFYFFSRKKKIFAIFPKRDS